MTRAEERLIMTYAEKPRMQAWEKLAIAAVPEETLIATDPSIAAQHSAQPSPFEELPAPDLKGGQYDSTVAVTSVAAFHTCPRRYYLGSYIGLEPEPERPGSGAIQTGIEVHNALSGGESSSAEANELAERFRKSELGQRAARAPLVEHEYDFLFALEDVVLRGQIDLWFEEGGELVLVDYKTDRGLDSRLEYELQLRLYALALRQYSGFLPNRAVLHYLRTGDVIEVSLSEGELSAAANAVTSLAHAQDSLDFPLKEGGHCERCKFYRGLCPAGK